MRVPPPCPSFPLCTYAQTAPRAILPKVYDFSAALRGNPTYCCRIFVGFLGLVQCRPSCGNTPGAPCGWHGQTRLPVGPRMSRLQRNRTVKQVWRCHPSRVLPGFEPGGFLWFLPCPPGQSQSGPGSTQQEESEGARSNDVTTTTGARVPKAVASGPFLVRHPHDVSPGRPALKM
jgi:hypothetical protein